MGACELDFETAFKDAGKRFVCKVAGAGTDWTRGSAIGGVALWVKLRPIEGTTEIPSDSIQLINRSAYAVSYGRKRLRQLCRAAGVTYPPRTPAELLGAVVTVELDDDCRIKTYYSASADDEESTADDPLSCGDSTGTIGDAESDTETEALPVEVHSESASNLKRKRKRKNNTNTTDAAND